MCWHSGERRERSIRERRKDEFYLDGLDKVFEVKLIVIEELNHAVNFGMEFLLQQEVSISCPDQEAKLVFGVSRSEKINTGM